VAPKKEILLKSKISPEFSSTITINNVTYHVQTEDMGKRACRIISSIFLKGELVLTKKSDYSHLTKLKDFTGTLAALMEKQHKSAVDQFIAEKRSKQKSKPEYFQEVQQLLREGNGDAALITLRQALEEFPADPFLLSYFGCLLAVVENKPVEGITICENALKALSASMPFGSEFFYPVFYLNLGRAYMKGKRKKEAIKAFHHGLQNDPNNADILSEIKKIGTRKKPPLPFLSRSNPINKYIGKLLYTPAKKTMAFSI
jgi:tetratricopeptide (TPR) repeat protein